MEVPIVVLGDKLLMFDDYNDGMNIDLCGFPSCREMAYEMKALKGLIKQTIENFGMEKIVAMELDGDADGMDKLILLLEKVLLEMGANHFMIDSFLSSVKEGVKKVKQKVDEGGNAALVLGQRIRRFVRNGMIEMYDITNVSMGREESAIWLKGESAYVSVQYLKNYILPLVNISASEFKVIRDNLIEAGMLKTYENSNDYTKKVVFPTGKRAHVYEFEKNFLQEVERLCY